MRTHTRRALGFWLHATYSGTGFFSREVRTNDDGGTQSHGHGSVCRPTASAAGPSCSSVALMPLPFVLQMRGDLGMYKISDFAKSKLDDEGGLWLHAFRPNRVSLSISRRVWKKAIFSACKAKAIFSAFILTK